MTQRPPAKYGWHEGRAMHAGKREDCATCASQQQPPAQTTLRVEWEFDEEDRVARSATATVFFAAWVNQFGIVEWTCTDEDGFPELVAVIEEASE